MCDYSLEQLESRPAAVGDRLQVTGFQNTITRGFCAAQGPCDVAVCLLPGTELAFDAPINEKPDYVCGDGIERGVKVAKFVQVNMDNRHVHHDALELIDGTIVKVHSLAMGQTCSVLQLPHVASAAPAQAEPIENRIPEDLVVVRLSVCRALLSG